jgi:hypothetical protein
MSPDPEFVRHPPSELRVYRYAESLLEDAVVRKTLSANFGLQRAECVHCAATGGTLSAFSSPARSVSFSSPARTVGNAALAEVKAGALATPPEFATAAVAAAAAGADGAAEACGKCGSGGLRVAGWLSERSMTSSSFSKAVSNVSSLFRLEHDQWKPRYCVFDGNSLCLYRTESKSQAGQSSADAVIPLQSIKSVDAYGGRSAGKNGSFKLQFSFSVAFVQSESTSPGLESTDVSLSAPTMPSEEARGGRQGCVLLKPLEGSDVELAGRWVALLLFHTRRYDRELDERARALHNGVAILQRHWRRFSDDPEALERDEHEPRRLSHESQQLEPLEEEESPLQQLLSQPQPQPRQRLQQQGSSALIRRSLSEALTEFDGTARSPLLRARSASESTRDVVAAESEPLLERHRWVPRLRPGEEEDEVWENQRWNLVMFNELSLTRGWSHALLPQERRAFSDRVGVFVAERVEALDSVPLPRGWELSAPFTVDKSGLAHARCDADGWHYESQFNALDSKQAKGRQRGRARVQWVVRSRRWYRRRRPDPAALLSDAEREANSSAPVGRAVERAPEWVSHHGWLGMRGMSTGILWRSRYCAIAVPTEAEGFPGRPPPAQACLVYLPDAAARDLSLGMYERVDWSRAADLGGRVKALGPGCSVDDTVATADDPGFFKLQLAGDVEPRLLNADSADHRRVWVAALREAISAVSAAEPALPPPPSPSLASQPTGTAAASPSAASASSQSPPPERERSIVGSLAVRGLKSAVRTFRELSPKRSGTGRAPFAAGDEGASGGISAPSSASEAAGAAAAAEPAAASPAELEPPPMLDLLPPQHIASQTAAAAGERLRASEQSPRESTRRLFNTSSPATALGTPEGPSPSPSPTLAPEAAQAQAQAQVQAHDATAAGTATGTAPAAPFQEPVSLENEFLDRTIEGVSADELVTLLFLQDSLGDDAFARDGVTKVLRSEWSLGHVSGSMRTIEYLMPRNGPVPQNMVYLTMTLTQFAPGEGFQVEQVSFNPEVPYGKCFKTALRYVITPAAGAAVAARLRISHQIDFTESTIMKGFIRTAGTRECRNQVTGAFVDRLVAFVAARSVAVPAGERGPAEAHAPEAEFTSPDLLDNPIADAVIAASPDALCHVLYLDDTLMLHRLALDRASSVVAEPWQPNAGPLGRRTVTYSLPRQGAIPGNKVRIEAHFTQFVPGKGYQVDTEYRNEVPFGKSFVTRLRVALLPQPVPVPAGRVEPGQTQAQAHTRVLVSNSITFVQNSVLKGLIRAGVNRELRKRFGEVWIGSLVQWLERPDVQTQLRACVSAASTPSGTLPFASSPPAASIDDDTDDDTSAPAADKAGAVLRVARSWCSPTPASVAYLALALATLAIMLVAHLLGAVHQLQREQENLVRLLSASPVSPPH